MSTEIYEDAMEGLRMTRNYRSWTLYLRIASRFVSKYTFDPLERLGVTVGLIGTEQKTLVWTKDHNWNPPVPLRNQEHPTAEPSSPSTGSPSIAVTDHSSPATRIASRTRNTPTMAFSLFPAVRTTHQSDDESDISLHGPILPTHSHGRTSDDSISPLLTRPSEVHRSRAASASSGGRRISSETRYSVDYEHGRSSIEHLLPPASPGDDGSSFGGWTRRDIAVHSRLGYTRSNSDSALPTFDFVADAERSGLGIDFEADTGNRKR
jgi:hypothetical protein